jgi:hypothetical protein
MHNKPLWEMTDADLKECQKLVDHKIKGLETLALEMNTHVYNEIWLYIKEARTELEKAKQGIKNLKAQTK